MPTTFRGVDMPGAGLTDSELIAISSRRAPIRAWLRRSRLVTGIQLWRARRQMSRETLERAGVLDRDVLQTASLPYDALPFGGGEPQWMANPEPFVRVPDDERERSLERLVELTRNAGVQLVLAHPAYPVSRPHRCVLTRVATEAGVPVIEIEELLASAAATNGRRREDYFVAGDTFHPNARGQRRIAEGLAGLLVEQGLLPPAEGPGGGRDDPMRRNAQ